MGPDLNETLGIEMLEPGDADGRAVFEVVDAVRQPFGLVIRQGAQQRRVCGDEAIEKVAGVLAADLDHAPVGKKRCFHAKISCDMLLRNVCRQGINDKARRGWG